jgi:phage terminase Nu1 subunit (DNA packaging protein)
LKLYDKNAVAKFLDMTPKNVERLTEKGILQKKQGNLYSLVEVNHAYIKYLRDRNPETEEAVDLNEERAKLAKAKRLKAELELQVEKGELHRAEDVEKIMTATLINFKSRLSAIPAEEAEKLATMTDKAKIFIYLNDRIKEALAELANFEVTFKEEIKEDEEGND